MRQTPEAGQILGLVKSRGVKERPDWLAGAIWEHAFEVSPTNTRRCGDEHRKTPATSMGRKAQVNPWESRLAENLICSNLILMWGEKNQGPEFLYKNGVASYRDEERRGSVRDPDVGHSLLQSFAPNFSSLLYFLELSSCWVSAISKVVSSHSHWQLRS